MIFLSFAANFKLKDCLKHLFIIGKEQDALSFRKTLCSHYDAKHAQLYINGRSALYEAICELTPPNSKIIANGLTCYAVEQAISQAKREPIFVDINHQDFNFDIKQLEATLAREDNIGAIIIQNHLGLSADIQAIEKLAKKYHIPIIEDLAHCAGSHYDDGREVGCVGDALALSFGKDKSLDTTTGGAYVLRKLDYLQDSNNPNYLQHESIKTIQEKPFTAKQLRNRFYPLLAWFIRKTYAIKIGKAFAAFCFKAKWIVRSADGEIMTRQGLAYWQARLAHEQFKNLEKTAQKRLSFAKKYKLSEQSSILRVPILVNNRDKLINELSKQGIYLAGPWYDAPVSPKRYFKKSKFNPETCPNSVHVSAHILNLPLLPSTKIKPILELMKREEYQYGTKGKA